MIRALSVVLFLVGMSGCATEANFGKALEGSGKIAAGAKIVAAEAERDAIKANLMHLNAENYTVASVVCGPVRAIESTGGALGSFGDALETIHKVGEKPADTIYATYVAQFRKNAKNIAMAKTIGAQAAMDKAEEEALQKRVEADKRCAALYLADVSSVLGPTKPGINPRGAGGFALLFAFNELIKGGMAATESVQREQAVIATDKEVLPGLKRARNVLAKPIPKDFKPFVDYSALADDHPAVVTNVTQLGATVTLHRWFIAQQIEQSSLVIAKCSKACLGDPVMRKNLDDLTGAVEQYRNLAAFEPAEFIKTLDEGIKKASDAADGKASWAQILDGLLMIGDTISGLSDKFGEYKKSRE